MLVRLQSTINGSSWVALVLLGAIAGCAPATTPDSPLSQTPMPSPTIAATPSPSPTPQIDAAAVYNQALKKAESAQNLAKTALTSDDWLLVASRWQQAIASLKQLPADSAYHKLSTDKLPQFEQSFKTAEKRATQAKAAETARRPSTLAGDQSLMVTNDVPRDPGSGQIFSAPIKRRAGGTPIIEVMFNGTQTFDMIVDTGASGTVITAEMADALGVQIVGKTKVNTASQTGVDVLLGRVESIAVGNAVVKDVVVAIGNAALDVGLLGHDFFSDYDVTVKEDVVEFRKR